MTKQAENDIQAVRDRPDSEFVALITASDTPDRITAGELRVFPETEIARLGVELMRSLGCHVPTTECEAAVSKFVAALVCLGWTVSPPYGVPRS